MKTFFKDLKQMLNLDQLYSGMDTVQIEVNNLKKGYSNYLAPYVSIKKFGLDTLKRSENIKPVKFNRAEDLLKEFEPTKRIQIMEMAMSRARNVKNFSDVTAKQLDYKDNETTSYMVEVYRKFTLSIACLVLFFIGAPLGSIIRKGGLGWPLFYSVLFFIVYHVTSIIGEKLSENDVLTVFAGMWLSTFVLLPVGLFLTMKAANDSKIYSTDYYSNLIRRLKSKKKAAI